MLLAGVARSSITPPLGLSMAGYAARDGVANGTESDLLATALVLSDGQTTIAIFAFDLLCLQEPVVSSLRSLISHRLDIPISHVLLNFSHTHCGPTSSTFKYDDDANLIQLRQRYEQRLRDEMPVLAEQARQELRPARIATGTGEARIGINRRERQADKTVLLGENPDGPVDHEVRVLRIDDLTGRPIATVFAHGCHTVTMGPKCLRWSSDYVGCARDLVEERTGALSLFLQANAGDINPRVGIGPGENDSNAKNRTGTVLGSEVLKVHASLYSESIRGPKVLIGSLSKIPYYPRLPLSEEPDRTIRVREELLQLPYQELPSPQLAGELLAKWEENVRTLAQERVTGGAINAARLFRQWAQNLVKFVASGRRPFLAIPLQTVGLGDLAIVAVPGETFSSFGLQLKRLSPFRNTLVLGYSNGCVGYIPTADAYPENGWSITERYYIADMIFQGYGQPTALAPDANERLIAKVLEMLAALKS